MKTLNKTLSLVLVLVMVLGMFGVASAAKLGDFSDKDDVTYTEAVDYLTAAGIVAGDTATTINPKGDLTREQAAKLIAYAMLGQVAADNLRASAAPFSDVAADRWSAGYIAYCQKQGIINGLGDGRFAPTEKVTGYEYAKMLLCAIGYGVNGEFIGAGWELETATLSLACGIFTGNTKGASDASANREEAFLYTFNTLSALRTVSYNKNLGVYYVPGAGALNTNPVSTDPTREDTVGAIKFGMLRTADVNDFGYAAHYWAQKGQSVTGTYADKDITTIATITDGTPISEASNPNHKNYIASLAKNASGVVTTSFYYNGAAVADFSTTASYTAGDKVVYSDVLYVANTTHSAAPWNPSNFDEYSVQGATVTLLSGTDANAKKIKTVAVIEKAVAVLAADPVVKTSGSVTTVNILGITAGAINADYVKYPANLAKDDVVLWYKSGSTYYIEKAAEVTGKLTAYVLNSSSELARVTIGADNYYLSALVDGAGNDVIANGFAYANIGNYENSDAYTYYLDSNGYICYVVQTDDAKTLTNVLFVSKAAASAGLDGTHEFAYAAADGNSGIAKASNKGVSPADDTFFMATKLADGTYKLANIANQQKFTSATLAGNAIAYGITANKIEFLTKYTAAASPEASWDLVATKAAAQITIGTAKNITANSSTVFMYYDSAAKAYTLKTGINSALSYAVSDTTKVAVYTDANGVALMVVASGSTSSAVASTPTIFPVSPTQITSDANGVRTYTCLAFVNGAETPTYVVSYDNVAIGNLYYVTSYATNGYVNTVEPALVATSLPTVVGRAATNDLLNVAVKTGVPTASWNKDILSLGFDAIVSDKSVGSGTGSFITPSTAKVFLVDARDTADIQYSVVTPSYINAIDFTGAAQVGLVAIEASATDSSIATIYLVIA